MYKLNLTRDKLWNGCMLASIAHAIMTAHYPDLSFEQSWDGINYNVQDGAGVRGTITFHDVVTVAAFRNDRSSPLPSGDLTQIVNMRLLNAPPTVREVAMSETLQYLLDDVNGQIMQLITALFWGVEDEFVSNDSFEDLSQHGADIIRAQLLADTDQAMIQWQEYYEMTTAQSELVLSLYRRKVTSHNIEITLTEEEKSAIGLEDAEGIEECRESLAKIGIRLD